MGKATVTFRVDPTLKEDFAKVAQSCDRSSAELLRECMRDLIGKQNDDAAAYDAWYRREVQAGIDEANAGDLIPADEVEAEMARWRTTVRRRLARGS